MVWMKDLVMVWMKGLDGVDEGPSDGEEKILHYLYLTGSQRF